MSTDSDTLQTARASYDLALRTEASGFAEVVQPPRALSLEPLHLDLGDLSGQPELAPDSLSEDQPEDETKTDATASLRETPGFDGQPGSSAPPLAPQQGNAFPELPRVPHAEGTLVLPLSALHAQDKTLVLTVPAARQLEHTLVIAPPQVTVLGASVTGSDGGAETRVVPLEAWAPQAAGSAPELPANTLARATGYEQKGPLTALFGKFRALPMRQRILTILAPVTFFAVAHSYLAPSPSPEEAQRPSSPAKSAPAVTGVARAAVPASHAAAAPAPQSPVSSVRAASGKTLERAAADAVAEGNTAAALAIYKQLSAARPAVPAYGAAVRILEDRLRGADQ